MNLGIFYFIFTLFLPHILGQKLNNTQVDALAKLDPNAPWQERVIVKHRRLIGILIPLCFFELCWWALAIKHDYFPLFTQTFNETNNPRYIMSITMMFGAMVAGMTSEGKARVIILCTL